MIAASLLTAFAATAVGTLECGAADCRTVVSVRVPALLAAGVEVQLERYLFDDLFSVGLSLGGRSLAAGDYRSGHLGVGAELRRWLWRTGWADDLGGARLGGLFAALRLDAAAGRTWAPDGRALGDELQLEPTVQVGYRFCPWLRFELTPALGLGVSTRFDLSGRLAPRTRWHQLLGLTVGWAF